MATNGQFSWPSAGNSVAADGQLLMAADTSNELRPVIAVHGLSQCIVIAGTNSPNRGKSSDLSQAFPVTNGRELIRPNQSLGTGATMRLSDLFWGRWKEI